MLDVRIRRYVSPLAEQVLDDITPAIEVRNHADENATITGHVRIYRKSTDSLEYTSELAETELGHGTTATIQALSAWSPGAPADDDYFILADIVATSYLPGPPLPAVLGAFTFDVKPGPMGPAPAGHHTTHENGGMDEIDLTDMTGLLATAQTPIGHAATHEDGGADPLNVDGLHGELADDQPALSHDTEKHTHTKVFYENDFLAVASSAAIGWPWQGAGILVGTLLSDTSNADHPGVQILKSIATVNSGYYFRTTSAGFLLAGNEKSDAIFSIALLAGTTFRFGWHNTQTASAPVDGCYIMLDPATGRISGRTMNGSVPSTTATDFLLVAGTWYRMRVSLNANASLVTFTLFDEAGVVLWTDTLDSNIPTTPGHELGNAITVTSTGGAASLLKLDYMNLEIARVLVR